MDEPVVSNESQEVNVTVEAYKKVSQDMHKFKSEAKALSSRLAEIQAEQEAKEKAALEEKEDWAKLYKQAESKLKTLETERLNEKQKFIESHKINAVLQSLGGLKRTEYNKFINSQAVQVNDDGSLDESTILSEVDRFKKEHPELLKVKFVQPLPSDAPKAFGTKTIAEMSPDERAAARRAALNLK